MNLCCSESIKKLLNAFTHDKFAKPFAKASYSYRPIISLLKKQVYGLEMFVSGLFKSEDVHGRLEKTLAAPARMRPSSSRP